jgi:ABC-type amino acid transport substrate-binding protein
MGRANNPFPVLNVLKIIINYQHNNSMKLKYLLSAVICVVCLLNFPNVVAQTTSSSTNISKTDILIEEFKQGKRTELKFGYRQTSYPVSYIDPVTKTPSGFCNVFANELLKQLNEELARRSPGKFLTLSQIDVNNFTEGRYEGVKQGLIDIECGANSINTQKSDVEFSNKFFTTGIKLITQSNNYEKIKTSTSNSGGLTPTSDLGGLTVGVYEGSTTQSLLRQSYPKIDIEPYLDRASAIQALEQGTEIQLYAGDSIILRGIKKEKPQFKDYILYPPNDFITGDATEEYGLVVPTNNPTFLNIVNKTIERDNVKSAIGNLKEFDSNNDDLLKIIIEYLKSIHPFILGFICFIIGILFTAFVIMPSNKKKP